MQAQIGIEYGFAWKSFLIDLSSLNDDLKAISPKICGLAADSSLRVVATEPLSEGDLAAIQAHLDSLDPTAEAQKRQKPALRDSTLLAMKAEIVNKSWDEMTAVERKILMGLEVSDAELGV